MLDQRLLRNNPALIEEGLKSRGMKVDLVPLQKLCKDLKNLEEKRNSLQADGNSIGKDVGKKIKQGLKQSSEEISNLRVKGNQIKKQVAIIEEEEKLLIKNLNDQILCLPNLPEEDALKGTNEKDNKEPLKKVEFSWSPFVDFKQLFLPIFFFEDKGDGELALN